MTLYVDSEYYISIFHGEKLSGIDIEKYLGLAQEKIDSITNNRIVGIGFDNLTVFQKKNIQKAICLQAEYIYEHGYNNSGESDISSYNVLDISVTVNGNAKKTKAKLESMDEYAYDLVKKTGLACGVL